MTDRLGQLTAAGVAVWIDDLSRDRLTSGGLDRLRRSSHVVGVTTNPSIFAAAIGGSTAYEQQLRDCARRGVEVEEATRLLTATDVRWACDVLRETYDGSDGLDGRVSLEVDPRLAGDTEATIADAHALWWLVDRPNLFIKIPATPAGLPAITETLAQGISVNVTLIFSLQRYVEVMAAYLEGMERARAAGHDLSRLASVASFFVSRVDAEVDKRLEAIGTPEALDLRGRAAVANARLAYQRYTETFGSQRWQSLAEAGARPQRPLWASTSTKNPAYRDVLYVESLVAPGVVNTMPQATLEAFADHGRTDQGPTSDWYQEAKADLEALTTVGVDYDSVVSDLERQGVDAFVGSWHKLLHSVEDSLRGTVS